MGVTQINGEIQHLMCNNKKYYYPTENDTILQNLLLERALIFMLIWLRYWEEKKRVFFLLLQMFTLNFTLGGLVIIKHIFLKITFGLLM